MSVGRADRIDQFDANFVAQAKDFERAAKQDLEQYRNWLEHYAADDAKDRRKHERRLRREQARYRRRLRYRLMRRLAFRYGSTALRFIHAAIAAVWKAVAISAVLLALLAAATVKWIVVRVLVLARLAVRSAHDAMAWTRPRVYRLAVRSRRRISHGLDWVALQTARQAEWAAVRRQQARAFAEAKGSQALAFTSAKASEVLAVGQSKGSQALAFAGAKGSQALAFTSAQAKAGARATSHAVASGYAWSAARAQDCAQAVPPMMRATRRGMLRARRSTRRGVLQFRDGAAVRLAALRDAPRAVKAGYTPMPETGMRLLTFQPSHGALVPVEAAPSCTALAVIEPAPWTGAAQSGINITAPDAEDNSPSKPERKAMKARPRKPRRGPRRKHGHSPATPGKPRPRGKKKRPRAS